MSTREEMDELYRQGGKHTFQPSPQRLETMASLVEGPRVLDFGCGAGILLHVLETAHPEWELCGVDISGVALDLARKRGVSCPLFCQDTVPLDGGPWDTVVLGQVLEHVEDDAGLVEQAALALIPGGLLIVSVPNEGQVPSQYHRREYTEAGLEALLSRSGTARLVEWVGRQTRILMTVRVEGRVQDFSDLRSSEAEVLA